MKTPRQILLEHYRSAQPRLDVVRQNAIRIIAASQRADGQAPESAIGSPEKSESFRVARPLWFALRKAWLELIWPSRRAWAGLAAIWLAVLAANLGMKATTPAAGARSATPAPEVAKAFEEQRRLLTELVRPAPSIAGPAALPQPRPRSERSAFSKAC